MSSINQFYTFEYSQPSEYRLSHDSVFLAREVFNSMTNTDLANTHGLDICAGSGIIGMDFLFHRREAGQNYPRHFDFLDIQDVYIPHFEKNKNTLDLKNCDIQFLNCNYNDLQLPEFKNKYDIILSGPPYFLLGHGKLSPSQFKNRCRFFIDSNLQNFLLGIAHSLKPTGQAFTLLRDLPEHKWDVIAEAQDICQGKLKFEILGDIRGTHFVRLTPYLENV